MSSIASSITFDVSMTTRAQSTNTADHSRGFQSKNPDKLDFCKFLKIRPDCSPVQGNPDVW